MNGFLPWFFSDFLPPLLPLVIAVVVTISVVFWSVVVLGGARLIHDRRRSDWRR